MSRTSTVRSFIPLATLALVSAMLPAGRLTAQTADAGPDRTVSAGEGCVATVVLDGSGSTADSPVTFTWTGNFPEGDGTVSGQMVEVTLAVGSNEITLTLETETGETSTDTAIITVEDGSAPTVRAVQATPDMLWPPNHKMVTIDLAVELEDDCDAEPSCRIVRIRSDEPVNGRGDGNTVPDWRIAGAMSARVRAERAGPGDGRVYTITVECTDASGNVSETTTTVLVPHDRGRKRDGRKTLEPVDRTRVVFRANFRRPARSRLVAKLDVSESLHGLPDLGRRTVTDDVAGYDLVLQIGDAEITATFDRRGRIVTDEITAFLTRSGLLVVDLRGFDLATALGLDPGESLRRATLDVPIKATVVPPPDTPGVADGPVTLHDAVLEVAYRQKASRSGRGRTIRRARD